MARRGSRASPANTDAMLASMRRDGCSICGERPNTHNHEAHTREEHRPGEPRVVGFAGGERLAVSCPYCGEAQQPRDRGGVPEDLPHRVYAACCGGGWYEIVVRKQGRKRQAAAPRSAPRRVATEAALGQGSGKRRRAR